jgi:hypothetical protein
MHTLNQPDAMPRPDYQGGSIVNLMATLTRGLGGALPGYVPLRGFEPDRLKRYRHIVLLVIDGLGYHQLLRSGAATTLQRHLQGSITSVFPTTTATAITTFYTGQAPLQHGVTGWHTWFRELGCVLKVLPTRPRCGGPTLGESGIDVAQLFGHVPVFDRLGVQSHVIAPRHIAHSDFNRAHTGTARVCSYQTLAHMLEMITGAVCNAGDRGYVYAYWPELDRIAHEHGIDSDEAHGHLAELDAGIARLLAKLSGSDTLVIVTADHGITDTARQHLIDLADHPDLAEMLVLPLCGEPRVAYCYVRPDRCRDFECYVGRELAPYAALWPSRELVARNYFGTGVPHPGLHERIGDYTLIMKDDYVIKDWLFAERRYTQVGVHGGLSDLELHVPLVVAPC